MKAQHYTVILLYPDYMSDGVETFTTTAYARSPESAVMIARLAAFYGWDSIEDPDDLAHIMTFVGRPEIALCGGGV